MKEDSTIHLFMGKKEITLKDGRVGKIIKIEETREDIPFRGFNSREIFYIKGKTKKEATLLIDGKEQTFNIDVLMKLIKTEENKMEWIPYTGQNDLEEGKKYIITMRGLTDVHYFMKNSVIWEKYVTAYMELPKPYKKPKSLKDRLDEAVEKYCYKFSDKEWKDSSLFKWYIAFDWVDNVFIKANNCSLCKFHRFNFKNKVEIESFINSFTTKELMQIMKGEVR